MKDNLILSGKKCECGKFIDFTKEVKRLRKEALLSQKEEIITKLPGEADKETNTFSNRELTFIDGWNACLKKIKNLLK